MYYFPTLIDTRRHINDHILHTITTIAIEHLPINKLIIVINKSMNKLKITEIQYCSKLKFINLNLFLKFTSSRHQVLYFNLIIFTYFTFYTYYRFL